MSSVDKVKVSSRRISVSDVFDEKIHNIPINNENVVIIEDNDDVLKNLTTSVETQIISHYGEEKPLYSLYSEKDFNELTVNKTYFFRFHLNGQSYECNGYITNNEDNQEKILQLFKPYDE